MSITWYKLWRDIAHSKARTALVVLSMAIGVFVLGVIFGAYDMMVAGLEEDRLTWVPIHVSMWGQFGEEAEHAALREEGVTDVERLIDATINWQLEGEASRHSTDWHEGRLIARQDYGAQRMGLIRLDKGTWPEGRALAVETMTAQDFGIAPGDVLIVQSGRHECRLRVSGIIHDHDAGLPPRFGGGADLYATPETATWLTGQDLNRIDLRVESPSIAWSGEVADRVRARFDGIGVPVGSTWVRNPDEHWSKGPFDTLLSILILSGVSSLLVSVFLIVNTTSATVAQQVWQIGVMKVVGATGARVMRVYLAMGLIYGSLALLLAVPLGAIGAYWLAEWALGTLGIALGPFRVTPHAVFIQIAAGLAVPLLAVAVPVANGARVTPHAAIGSYGLGGDFGEGLLDRLMGALRWLPRPMALSLRNTFRRKARAALTLTALALGGALFMAIISVEASCTHTIDVMLGDSGADATIHFARAHRVERLIAVTEQVPGVATVEVWKPWGVRLELVDGEERSIVLVGLPPDSEILHPRVVSGRGLVSGDENAILLHSKVAFEEGIAVGDEVRFDLNDRETAWTVVGLVTNAEERSFVPFDSLSRETGSRNIGWRVTVMAERHDPASQRRLVEDLRAVYAMHHFEADDFATALQSQERIRSRFEVILYILLTISLLAAAVGGIGLMGTMSINVVERRREIGVMRATGATSAAVAAIFVAEGVVIGVLSWVFAVPISYPGARLFSDLVGSALLRTPFEFVYSADGMGMWLVVVSVVSALASLWPALRATRVSVREALAYE